MPPIPSCRFNSSLPHYLEAIEIENERKLWQRDRMRGNVFFFFFLGNLELAKLRCFGELRKLDGGGQKRYTGNWMEVEGLN